MAAQVSRGKDPDSSAGSFACYFSSVRAGPQAAKRRMSSRMSLDHLQDIPKSAEDYKKTISCVLRAAWALVLHYYTRSEDVCFGYDELDMGGSVAEKPEPPGPSSRTSVARVIIEDTMSLNEVFEQTKGKFPLVEENGLSGAAGNSRNGPRSLYNTAVMLRVRRSSPIAPAAVTFVQPQVGIALPEECKVRVLAKYLNNSLSVFLEWWHPDISPSLASNIAEVYNRMLSNILTKPNSVVKDLNFITERDRKQILEWNAIIPETVERCVHEVIEDQVRLRPDSEAVCAWDGSLTFLELDRVASRLAHYLVELGVRPETRVSLCFEKSKWNIVAMLAVLKAGGAFVPLDPSHPIPRLQALVRAVGAKILLCSSPHAAHLADVAEAVLAVDDERVASLQTRPTGQRCLPRPQGTNAAYILFTSGSTGEPKGTVIEHRAYCSSAKAHASPLLIESDSRVLQFAAHTFDASLVEILTSLMHGACVCIPSEEARLNNIVQAINDMRVNHAVLTPSFIRFLQPSAVPGLKSLVLAGEALSPANVETWSEIKLANGYGPTESSVAAVVNPRVTKDTDCQDIGFPVGVRCWVVDPDDHDILLPIGCTGELLLEGPSLARCYLNNPEKTTESFIYDPAWTKIENPCGSGRRFYKTGDLVRYNSDSGSFNFVGRKDTQVKFHGQRVELGEIESHLAADPNTKHGLVLLPKSGHLAHKLVAVITLSDKLLDESVLQHKTSLKLLDQPNKDKCVQEIRERMSSLLPVYMVPSIWLCVEALPVLASRKLDRKAVARWVETIREDVFLLQTAQEPEAAPGEIEEAVTDTERKLREIWSRVLNIPLSRTSLNHSFLSLGGDSITAMTCMNQCKMKGIGVTVQEVLRSKSIRELAACVKLVSHRSDYHEDLETPFDLSPIQDLHFQVRDDDKGHFNQSVFLRVNREIAENDLRKAIEIIIWRHSMLRARFHYNRSEMKWQQRITRERDRSYRFRVHTLSTLDEVKDAIADSQGSLNAVRGPVVAIDLFHLKGDGQLLSMTGHHLVIDLVSWRVILEDLEELLLHPQTPALLEGTLPFQSWCRLQAEHCRNYRLEKAHVVHNVPLCDLVYWGMQDRLNVYGDVVCHGFELDSTATSLLLTECNEALRTEPVDLFLAALIYSFGHTFRDRSAPVVHNEGHGREAWDPSIDISRTVGWFTIIYPVLVQAQALGDIVETLVQVKDHRRRVPDNGRAYFAHSILTGRNNEPYRYMEITFNYLGRYQQLERTEGLFQPVEGLAGETTQGGGAADVGRTTPRFGLFEISAVVVQDTLRFSFSFNGTMRHQERIRQWITSCGRTLRQLAKELPSIQHRPTISDFPLLSLTYEDLSRMTAETLPQMGIRTLDEVEDIYPCSPMQRGLMISRTRDSSFYAVHGTYEVKAANGQKVDIERLAHAWQQVVARHSMLRTVFAENLATSDLYCQIVLHRYDFQPPIVRCLDEHEVLPTLDRHLMVHSDRKPAHQFTICQTETGRVFCRLEISHTIMDGASISIILRDLELAYCGNLSQAGRPLFSNFISYLQMQPQEASVEYWKSYLSDMEPCHVSILNDGFTAERQYRTLRLEFKDFARLQSLCETYGLTVANALHGAWALTLRCYTGSEEVCFGYLLSERDVPVDKVEDAVGPMINILACRVNMPSDSLVRQVLERIQEDYVKSLPFKHTSLADVQHALGLSGTALFNTCFSYRKLPPPERHRQPVIEFSEFAGLHDPTEYLVTVNVEASEKDAVIDLDYWTDSLSDGQAANMASTFLRALENIIAHPTEQLGQLDYVSDSHLQQIVAWNSAMPSVIDRCIHDVFQEQVKMHPDSPAICSWDGNFSYVQVDELSSRLANYLVMLGVVPETFVALCFDKSAYTIISMLAVLKAGGGCVPLDAGHPKAALDLRVLETGAQIVLASPSRASLLDDVVPYVISVDDSFLSNLPEGGELVSTAVQPSNTAFIIFTSGSTGKPKGVVLEHHGLVTSAEAHGAALGVGPDTRFLQFASYSFDNSLEEIFTTLMRGGCVCVPSEHDRMNNLAKAMNELDVNFTDLTATVAAFFHPSDVPKLKGLAIGGEAPTKEIRDTWGKVLRLQNIYGPTECSINCAHNPNVGDSGDVTNIGRSVGSVSWIVDPANHNLLLPVGCVGELLVEGPILARGYLNDTEKTQQNFIEDPAFISKLPCDDLTNAETAKTKRRMYKTGDLVRYNSDGSLVYLGRKDTQVKLNGQRIELGEIEHRIKATLSSESQCAVDLVISRNQKSRKALVAFLCLKPDGSGSAGDGERIIMPMSEPFQSLAMTLQTSLASSLPAYMVPSLYIPVLSMPLTSSGKLNRRMLRTLAESILEEDASAYRLGGQSGRAPSTQPEKVLRALWASVLGIDASTISAEDTFFRHGGDSIAAMRLVTSARQEGYSLSVADIFKAPRLSEMARSISGLSSATLADEFGGSVEPFSLLSPDISVSELKSEIASICQISTDAIEDVYPCTPLQEGLIALSSKQPGSYVTQNIYALSPDTNIRKFEAAWQKASESEVILRTRIIHSETHGFLQVVVREPLLWESADDVAAIPETQRQLPSANGGVLSRYTIVGEGTNSPCFVWTAHHAVYDGWSLPTLLSKVESCYDQAKKSDGEPGCRYPQFVKYLAGIDPEQSNAFWRERLEDITTTKFPPSLGTSYKPSPTSQFSRTLRLPAASGLEVTVPSIIRAAWALTISVYSYSDDVVFGEILTGRDAPLPGISGMIGPALATVPMRIRINRDLNVAEFLRDVQGQAAAIIPYQFSGLQNIMKLSQDAKIACDFQNLLAIEHDADDITGGFLKLLSGNSGGSNFFTYPLNVSCTIKDGQMEVQAHYDENLIPTSQLARVLSQFETLLTNLCSQANAEEKVGQMELVGVEDLTTIQRWNADSLKVVDRCIHDMIDDKTRAHPDDMAVCSWDATFTYRELDQLSTSLAHRIHELVSLKAETFIPVCFEKSAFTVVSMLAILKAGCAFAPLDPQHPTSRLREIVTDLDAKLILCSPHYIPLCREVAAHALAVDLQMLKALPFKKFPPRSCSTKATAYAIFTSGTTGKPKGCIVEHAAFCSAASKHAQALLVRPKCRFLQFASYTFDASLVEILTVLIMGGCVCVPDETARLNALADFINDMRVDTALLTPSMAQMIQPSDVPCLRTLILGGEAMSSSHVSTWAEKVDLVNGYGPSECSVAAAAKAYMTVDTSPTNIGTAIGTSWIVDPDNHDRLVPIGAIGELLIEGPTLARGYLNNEQKTSEVFIKNPKWTTGNSYAPVPERRMYKTGDLVKYAPGDSGEMLYIGRKDNQAKLHGQRLELEEVEHHLNGDGKIMHALVTMPKAGNCAKKLVAVLSLRDLPTPTSNSHGLEVVTSKDASEILPRIQERLREYLPAYMIPSNWVILRKIPLLPSGKLNRRQIEQFVETMDDDIYQQIMAVQQDSDRHIGLEITDTEARLRTIWASVLNLPPESIGLDRSFLHLGGDSMSAMAVMSKCRSENLGVTVQDIITSKSIRHLASLVTRPEEVLHEEEDDQEFDLSPIQQLYFRCMQGNWTHFNQSMLLRLTRPITADDVRNSISELVKRHSMLRARFSRDGNGVWKQRITKDVEKSYLFRVYQDYEAQNMEKTIEDIQRSLNIVKGPILAVGLFECSQGDLQLFISVHHLVVDVVSWGIILQDLEDIFQHKNIAGRTGTSFQKWCRLLSDNAKRNQSIKTLPVEDVPLADLGYWGMEGRPNYYGDVVTEEIEFESTTSSELLAICHGSLQIEFVDVLLATLLMSFCHVFPDRSTPPAIYNEGHGREPWDSAIDISRTVGWFTTMAPVHLPKDHTVHQDGNLLKCITWVKDLRKSTPGKGLPYFAYRLLTWEGHEKFGQHWPMEMAFNYLGQHQSSELTEKLLQPVNGTGQSVNSRSDIGPGVPRFALIEISAAVIQNRLNLSFSYNKFMKRQTSIRRWAVDCRDLLCEAVASLKGRQPERSLSDFPLLPLSYNGLDKLKQNLLNVGISSLDEVEDVYPCSPMQQGILLSQLKDPKTYSYRSIFEVRSPQEDHSIDLQRLADAWQTVIRRHPTLRTIFIDGIHESSLMDQVVFKSAKGRILTYKCDDTDARKTLSEIEVLNYRDGKPPYRLVLCKTKSGRVFCRLDITNAISDGSSMPIILRDLSRAYMNVAPDDSESPLYSDFIAHLQSVPKERGALYWKEYLAGTEPCLFPSLLDARQSEKKLGSQILVLKQTSEIQEFCKRAGVTISNLLQLVWGLVLRCYTGSDEICFGYLSSGRDVPVKGIQDAVGAFINMLTFRIDLKDDLLLEEALKKTQEDFIRSMEHQSVSLAEVQHELGLSETSLFNTAFTFQRRRRIEGDALPAISFESFDSHDPSEYKLAVNVEMSDQSTEVHFSFWMDYLSKEQVEHVADVFEHVLYGLVQSRRPGLRIKDIDFFGPLSCHKVREWNHMATNRVEKCIHVIIEEHGLRQPISPAIHGWDASFTYKELNAVSSRLASRLQQYGVGPEVFVPLCFEKSAWAIVAQVAVMKAGGAFVSLDPSHPEDRLRNLIDDVGADIVVCSAQQYDKVSRISKTAVIVDGNTVSQLPHRSVTLSASANPSNAAYIIYTSGSTGKPKGTVIEHAAYCTSALAHGEAFHVNSNSRVFQFASYTFDASIMETLTTLIMGGCVCVPSDEERMNDIQGAIRRMNVNWLFMTPSVVNTLKPEHVPTVKVLTLGGEKLTQGNIERWKSRCLIDAYGPTECSVVCAGCTKVNMNGEILDTDPATIGKALGGRSWIVDPLGTDRLVPVGAIGELVIEGPTVARGYLNNEKKTSEVFIQDPQWTKHDGLRGLVKQGARMYRTGDLVHYNPDGTLSYVARMDMQIKLNGQRIELGEIEYQCGRYLPEHTHLAVDLVAAGTKSYAKKLAMFFTAQINDDTQGGLGRSTHRDQLLLPMSETIHDTVRTLEKSLSGVLPSYMIPQLFFPVSSLPCTSSGKLDRRKLHGEVQALSMDSLKSYTLSNSVKRETPRDKMEQALQSLWEAVLNIPSSSIGIDDSFFKLGGDSITAMKLVGLARSRGIELSVVDIFRCPVLKDMAGKCGSFKEKGQSQLEPFSLLKAAEPIDLIINEVSTQCRIDPGMVADIYPCSPLQEGLITLSIKQPGAYVAQNVLRLSNGVDIPKFKAAWQQLVDKFDILRTRIVHTASANFLQVVLREQPITWHTAESLEEIAEETTRVPEHEGGLLTRYTLVQEKDSSAYHFVWSIHHALYDGWGLSILLKRVEDIYFGRSSGQVNTSYATFIDYLQQRDVAASDRFWASYLWAISPVSFPQEISRPSSGQDHDTKTLCGATEISQSIFSLNLTTPALIRAAWALVVANRTRSNDVCFGETLTGRNVDVSGITEIAGPILTTVPTRIQVNPQAKITDYLAEVQRISTEMIPHQHSGLQHIRRLSEDAALACDFQNLLIVQTAEDEANDELWQAQNDAQMKNFFTYPLVVECKVSNTQIENSVHYDEGVISGWEVERLLQQFSYVLRQLSAVTESDSRQLDKVDMISPEDKEEISLWNIRRPQCIEQCIHEIFQQRCLSQPGAPAVCAWDGELTYSELNEYASRLAMHLRSLGVGPEVFVPLCLDKSAWTIVTMMGVLIAGGAVVPLDPSHPLSRHQEIVKELDANVILHSPNYSDRYSGIVQKAVPIDEGMIKSLQSISGRSRHTNSATSSNAAYAIFTSGSTGRAKGITIEHRAFVSSSMAFGPAMKMNSTSRVLQFASLSFDAALMEIFTTLTTGGCVCVPSEEERLRDISGAICRMHVSWTLLTPSVANLIDPATVPCLKVLVCGGEAMSPEVIARWTGHVEVINAYGPSEASVVATVNANVSSEKPSCIGYGISPTLTWVVDPEDHDQLCPLGTVGELALEGPTLARGYLNDVLKTTAAFVENPAWAATFPSPTSAPRRIHKTGDLVKYNPEGSLEYVGRKDNQVKLHGQRMDLGEIEHRLDTDPRVRHVIVLMPKTGFFQERLISVLSLNSLSAEYTVLSAGACELVNKDARVDSELAEIRNRLSTQLPSYMVPQAWAVVKHLPMLVSGKLDRKKVQCWVEDIPEETYRQIVGAVENDESNMEATGVASMLQEIWAQVLNVPREKVKLNQSFLSLGGDSITAMAVVSRSRRQKMKLSLHDVLRSESIVQLARTVESGLVSVQHEEKVDEPFGLYPIQQLYFQAAKGYQGRSRFNQSFTLRLSRYIKPESLESAIRTVVNQHSMLRARFGMNKDGRWEQRFTSDANSSYRFQVHHVDSTREAPRLIGKSQESLDIQNGPVFAADLFETRNKEQFLFLVAHHLCVDMVSWRVIIQDLQDILETGSLPGDKPLSFQTWCALQEEHIKRDVDGGKLPFQVIPANIGYWGMDNVPNSYSEVEYESFVLDEGMTTSTMTTCHDALRTEPIDLLISAIVHSFRRTFNDRYLPTLFNEGHGREPWDSDIDPSRTVGWFTNISPLQVTLESDDVLDTLRRVKDTRRSIADNGRRYLPHRFLASNGRSQFAGSDVPMEILFNYLGAMQQLERDDSLFQNVDLVTESADALTAGDMGPDTVRLALFEISAVVVHGKLQFSFMYNRRMQRLNDIRRWVSECKWTLEEIVIRLRRCAAEPTLSDYPLLPITYEGLRRLVKEAFPEAGITHRDQVEDIYPCTPTQEGILLSQLRDRNNYLFNAIFEIKVANSSVDISPQRLIEAWQKVVDRHAALRTTFVNSVYRGGAFDQVVLKKVDSGIIRVECDDSEAVAKLHSIKLHENNVKRKQPLPHQITICTTLTGRVLIKFEMNHAVIDGGSTPILMRDLALAYDGRLPEGRGPLYSNYIRFIRSQSPSAAIAFWKRYLADVRSCHLPRLNANPTDERGLASLKMAFDQWSDLQQYCEKTGVTLANVVQAAWALVLRKYTGSDDVCFGYLSAGRDAPVNGIQDTIGVFINMLCCRVRFAPSQLLAEIPSKIQSDYLNGIPYQRCSLAQVQHELGLHGKQLFNTALSIQNHSRSSDSEDSSLVFVTQTAHDPSEYAVTLNIETARNDEGVMFRYWTDMLSEEEASTLAATLARALTAFVQDPAETVSRLDLEKTVTSTRVEKQQWISNQDVSKHEDDEARQLLEKHPALQSLIDERVQTIIKQMFKMDISELPSNSRKPTADIVDRNLNREIQGQVSVSEVSSNASEDIFKERVEDDPVAPQIKERGRRATLEQKLLRLWSQRLGVSPDSITKSDSFFELGGDSITAMNLVADARDEGLILTVADVFRNPVFEEMAAIIQIASRLSGYSIDGDINGLSERRLSAHAGSDLYERFALMKAANIDDTFLQKYICPKIGVFKGGIDDVLPVTDFQALAITGALLDSRWMLNYFCLEGSGPLDFRRLKQSCFRVVHAFDILRTVFVSSKGRFLQVILRKVRPEFLVYETDDGLDEFTAMLQQRDYEQCPGQGEPFVQFIVVKEKNTDRHRILIRLSHAQYDGVCLPKILSAIKAGYEGGPIPSTPSFANYVRASARTVTSEHYEHWRALLQGSRMTEIVSRQGPNYRKSTGATPKVLKKTARLPSMAHGNITTATVIKAAWALTLARITASSDVVFGHTISGRNTEGIPGVETIVGPCMNIVPVRVRFGENWTALELLRYIQDQQVANMPYEALGFRQIIKHCTDWPNWTNFSTVVQHDNSYRQDEMQLGENNYRIRGVGSDEDLADFSIISHPSGRDRVEIAISFSLNGAVTETLAQRVLDMICETAEGFTANPGMVLPTPAALSALPTQTIEESVKKLEDETFTSSQLKGLSRPEILVLSDVLSRTWQQVLTEKDDNCPAFKLDSSFFELGGDIVSLAQVAWLLEQEDFKVRLDDLIEHPTMLGQMAVLVQSNWSAAKKMIALSQADTAADSLGESGSLRPKARKSSSWAGALSLARRMVRREGRN
ncbi:hypothetical protein VTN77DRAFT_4931 [Rasamsonia byssochlamydoides]|uniref:uncharacterized protein n=1 Tax=Rasamsonia byssochlamydoides TaxID=89139 RepID=UPI003743AA14